VLSILGDDMRWVIIAMLPGHARPVLRPATGGGRTHWLSHVYRDVTISRWVTRRRANRGSAVSRANR
jgi:hypothetical protein